MHRSEAIRRIHTNLSKHGCDACRLQAAQELLAHKHTDIRATTLELAQQTIDDLVTQQPEHNNVTCVLVGYFYLSRRG